MFSGNIADYDISRTGSVLGGDLTWTVAHTRGTATDGIDTIRNVEILQLWYSRCGLQQQRPEQRRQLGTEVVIVGDCSSKT